MSFRSIRDGILFQVCSRKVAVRCFLSDIQDQEERYAEISKFVLSDDLSYTSGLVPILFICGLLMLGFIIWMSNLMSTTSIFLLTDKRLIVGRVRESVDIFSIPQEEIAYVELYETHCIVYPKPKTRSISRIFASRLPHFTNLHAEVSFLRAKVGFTLYETIRFGPINAISY